MGRERAGQGASENEPESESEPESAPRPAGPAYRAEQGVRPGETPRAPRRSTFAWHDTSHSRPERASWRPPNRDRVRASFGRCKCKPLPAAPCKVTIEIQSSTGFGWATLSSPADRTMGRGTRPASGSAIWRAGWPARRWVNERPTGWLVRRLSGHGARRRRLQRWQEGGRHETGPGR